MSITKGFGGADGKREGGGGGGGRLSILWHDLRGIDAEHCQVIAVQIWGRCVASANTPAALMARGVDQWLALPAPAHKLVLGLPWCGSLPLHTAWSCSWPP